MHLRSLVLILLLPAVEDLIHVVFSGGPTARLLNLNLSLIPFVFFVIHRLDRARLIARRPEGDAKVLLALLQVAVPLLLLLPLLPGVLVALMEQVLGVVIQLHVQLVQLRYTLDLKRRGQRLRFHTISLKQKGQEEKRKQTRGNKDEKQRSSRSPFSTINSVVNGTRNFGL